ncbi:MAG: YdeI/OmpD-associated family protein [Caldilineaceae bacterium]|nr:YdeI/OmpD-associated family protein [Caldilineaceae bacterium]MCB9139366.1 YdeI/OmpD-associated family protein [Caldilineaceae bacterium]
MEMRSRSPLNLPDDLIQEETGRFSAGWNILLDAWGAPQKGHAAAVRHLQAIYGLSERWANIVAVRYAADRDLQEETSIPADLLTAMVLRPAARVRFEALTPAEQRAIILPIETAAERSERKERIREAIAGLIEE